MRYGNIRYWLPAQPVKVPSKDTATAVGALGKHVRKLPQQLRRSLTWEGKEMADHKSFTIATNVTPVKTVVNRNSAVIPTTISPPPMAIKQIMTCRRVKAAIDIPGVMTRAPPFP
jgi:hypothetical protein